MTAEVALPHQVGGRLYDCIAHWAGVRPAAEAVVAPGMRLTYQDLLARVDACAAALIGAGVRGGDRVAALAPPGPEFLVTFLATAAIGGIWVGLNPRYADPELDAIVARIDPKVVFAAAVVDGRSYRRWTGGLAAGVQVVELGADQDHGAGDAPSFGAWLDAAGETAAATLSRRRRAVDAADPCLMVFTSGSTGAPKGVMISQAALVGASAVQLRVWPAQPLRVLNNLPVNHIGCVGDLSCYALVGGGTLVFLPRFDPESSLTAIETHRVTVWGQVPTMFQLTLDSPGFVPERLGSLQLIFWGGAHASSELIDRLRGLAPRLATSYGQTETVGSVTFAIEGAGSADALDTVGRPVEPYEVRVVDADGAPVEGEGEVQVRSPFAMSGYWRDAEATVAAVTPDGWRGTGDIGLFTPAGELRLIGRVHEVFKSGGYNVYPQEVEAALAAVDPVREAAVVGVPDPLYGTVAMAFVTVSRATTEQDLRARLRGRLANYKVPKRIVIVEDLPRLPVGKVDKQALRARADRS